MHERKDNEQQNIIIFQDKPYITEIDNYFSYNEYKKNRWLCSDSQRKLNT